MISNKDEIDISKIFPIQEINQKFMLNGNGDITFSYKLELPEVYTLNSSQYNAIHQKLINTISRLPEGTCVHKQDFYYLDTFSANTTKEYSYTAVKDNEYFNFRPILQHYCLIHITYSKKVRGAKVSYYDNSLRKMPDYIFSNTFKASSTFIQESIQRAELFEGNLRSIRHFDIKRLTKAEMAHYLVKTWNQTYDKPEVAEETLQPFTTYDNELRIGDKSINIVSLTGEGEVTANFKKYELPDPGTYKTGIDYNPLPGSSTSFSFPISLGLPVNHIVNTIIEVSSSIKLKRKFFLEDKGLNLFIPFGLGEEVAKAKSDRANFAKNLVEESLKPCLYRQNVILFDTNKERLNKHTNSIASSYSEMNEMESFIENYQTGNLFIASLQGNTKANFRTLISTINNGVTFMPLETHLKSDSQGITFVDRFGKPVVWDLASSDRINNKNKLVFGPSGSGKSFWLNHYVSQCIAMGYHLIIMDKGGSFKETIALAGGHYIDTSNRKNLRNNIFICNQDDKGNYRYNTMDEDGEGGDDHINYILVVLQKLWKKEGPLEDNEASVLRKLIRQYYDNYINKKKLFPLMDNFYDFTKFYEDTLMDVKDRNYIDLHSLRNALEPFVKEGEYSYFLNSRENVNFEVYRVLGIDMEGIENNPMLYEVQSYIMVQNAANKIMNLPRRVPKCLLVDEAVEFFTGNTGQFVGGQARKIRKRGGELIISTQAVDFLEDVDPLIRKSLLRNADTKILIGLGEDQSATIQDATQFLSLTQEDIEIISTLSDDMSLPYRESFIKLKEKPYIVRLEVSRASGLVYSTTPEIMDKKKEYIEHSNGDVEAAIDRLLNEIE